MDIELAGNGHDGVKRLIARREARLDEMRFCKDDWAWVELVVVVGTSGLVYAKCEIERKSRKDKSTG
jgi:hypothetical protein